MIQPNEKLLPGNVVMWRNRFYTLTKGDIYSMDYLRNFFSPIPLTPEILVQWCGWHRDEVKYWKTWGRNGFYIILWDDYYNAFKIELGKGHYKVLDTLNHLQNLFYFLSGEEMPVNIPNH